jgi:hypothetical protein
VVRLLNSGFSPDAKFDDEFEGVVSGWKMALATLKYWLEHHDRATRTHRLVIEPAQYEWSALSTLFSTREGRRRWLEPTLQADAETLVDTGREVLLAWPQRQGVIGLKAFRMGPQPVVAADLSSWSPPAQQPVDTDRELHAALIRLKTVLG